MKMFLMVAFLLLGLAFAGFPSDDYDYEELEDSFKISTTLDPSASEVQLKRIRGNIKKLFAGRELPSELMDPVVAKASTEPHKPMPLEAAANYPTEYVFRLRNEPIGDNDEGPRFNYDALRAPYRGRKTTTPSTTTCKDEEGYRIRCTTNSTANTTLPTTTETTPLVTADEDIILPNDTDKVKQEKRDRYKKMKDEFFANLTREKEAQRNFSSWEFIRTSEAVEINKLVAILSNLTYIYDTDIVKQLHEELNETGFPFCPSTISTTFVSTTTPEPVDNLTGTTTTRCFVCGLEQKGVPDNARCADAFASDFFPTAPVDFTARASIERYKKHCKYIDKPSWHFNGTNNRLMWGRWTGGCSVRWIDLSGIYTQRACRNRNRPVLGHHYGSKRMAKLEYALNKEKDGCIISPQASLVPFSRGVSLYARFHACVCSGNYCNRAERLSPLDLWPMVVFVMAVKEHFVTKM